MIGTFGTLLLLSPVVGSMLLRVVKWASADANGNRSAWCWINVFIALAYTAFFIYAWATTPPLQSDSFVQLGDDFYVVVWMIFSFPHCVLLWAVAEIGMWRDRTRHKTLSLHPNDHDTR